MRYREYETIDDTCITLMTLLMNRSTFYNYKYLKSATPLCADFLFCTQVLRLPKSHYRDNHDGTLLPGLKIHYIYIIYTLYIHYTLYCKHVRIHGRTEAHIDIISVYCLELVLYIYFKIAAINEKDVVIPKILLFCPIPSPP